MSDKPEEPVIRTDVMRGEFSPSGVEAARCFRRFYYQKILGLKPKVTPTALMFGVAIHSAVEKFYELHGSGLNHEEVKLATVQTFVEEWNKTGLVGDMKRNLETGILIMNNYCDTYRHDSADFKKEDIESAQWMPMPNGTTLLVKMDRVLNNGNMIILVDTKTTSMPITEWYFRQFENHLPTSLYAYVVAELLGHCDQVQIDAIKVPPPPATSKTAAFGRNSFIRTDLQIQDAINSYSSITNYIMNVLNNKPEEEWVNYFYCNQAECDKYGGCSFLPICKHGLDHPSVLVDFDQSEPRRKSEVKV